MTTEVKLDLGEKALLFCRGVGGFPTAAQESQQPFLGFGVQCEDVVPLRPGDPIRLLWLKGPSLQNCN